MNSKHAFIFYIRKLRKDNDLVDGMVLKFYQNLLDTKVEVDVGDIPPKIVAIRTQKRLESDVVLDFKVSKRNVM